MNMLQPLRRFLGLAMLLLLGTLFLPTVALAQNPPPPMIITQPASQTVTAGHTATFSVVATGTGTLSYQWQKNGANIAGAMSSSFTTPPTTTFDVGTPLSFTVLVKDPINQTTSSNPATLTVNSPSGPFAYVTIPDQNSIAVIDTSSDLVVATISICADCGPQPEGLAVTPGGKFVYVAEKGSGSVAVIDTTTNTIIKTITLPTFGCGTCFSRPVGVAVTPDGSRVYVTDVGLELIDVIDAATNTVVFPPTNEEGDVSSLNGPIVITPDGSAAFYTFGLSSVGRFDTSTNSHTTTLTVGNGASGIAITPNGGFIYVSNTGDNTVSVIPNTPPNFGGGGFPTAYPKVSLPLGSSPGSMAITPDGKTAYVVNQGGSGDVSVISTATNTTGTPVTGLCSTLNQIAITSDGTKAYVADAECGTANVIKTVDNSVTSVSTGSNSNPFGVAASGSQTKTLGGPGTTTIFTFNTDTYKLTGVTNHGGEQVTVDAFLISASKFPTLNNFPNEKCLPYGDYSSGGVDTCVEFQVHCQVSATDTTPCNFVYLVATGYDLPADLAGGIGGPDFLVAHGKDCPLASDSVVQSIFLSYDATVKDPTTRGGSRGPSCFVATYTPGAPVISTGTTSRFIGWGPPVVDTDLNEVKAGSTRPLSFQFFDSLHNPVTNLSLCNTFTTTNGVNVCRDFPAVLTPWVNLAFYRISCPNSNAINASTDTTLNSSGGSGLQNLGGGSYQFNWKTQKSLKGSCANVVVTFDSTLTVVPAMLGFQFN